jgi:hypothetical protein
VPELQFRRIFPAFFALLVFSCPPWLGNNSSAALARYVVVESPRMTYQKTPAVADQLGISYSRLINLLRTRRLDPPQKDTSGDYVWSPEDVERARQVLAATPARDSRSAAQSGDAVPVTPAGGQA